MSVNKVILMGNVGKDPQVRDVSGTKVASFTLATTERAYAKRDGTQVPERTEWHNIVMWRGQAEVAEKYIRKGTKLYVEGKLTTRTYEKDGIKHYLTEVVVDNLELCGQPPQQSAPQPAYQQPQAYQQPAYQQPQAYQPAPTPQPAPMPAAAPSYQSAPQQQYYQPQPQPQAVAQPAPQSAAQQSYTGLGVDDLPFR